MQVIDSLRRMRASGNWVGLLLYAYIWLLLICFGVLLVVEVGGLVADHQVVGVGALPLQTLLVMVGVPLSLFAAWQWWCRQVDILFYSRVRGVVDVALLAFMAWAVSQIPC